MTWRRVLPGVCLVGLVSILNPGVHATTVMLGEGDDLQAAINAAKPGDTILLQPGVTFRGNFALPNKSGAGYITIRTAGTTGLPQPGVRITPAASPYLARIESPNDAASLRTLPGAHHWRLELLEFPPTRLGYNDILQIGDGSSAQSDLSNVPYDIVLDRLYIHGHRLHGQKRGVALNARNVQIRNCHISDIKAMGMDTQAIGGWNGPGPFTIENNYLEATGENFLLGGSDPAIPNLVSEDVVVRHNYMSRPMAWKDPIIPAPSAPTARAGGGGSLVAGTHAYRIVARRPVGSGATGRSTASPAVAVEVAAGSAVSLTWAPVPDAAEYRVHVTRPSGAQQYWTVTAAQFVDTGTGGVSGAAPTEQGDRWQVKNIFELKNARRVLVEYNVFENNWLHAQPGYAIVLTPRNQNGACTWCVIEDVTFQYNVVRNSSAGINLSGYDWPNVSAQTNRIRIRHNLFYKITKTLGGNGWFMLIGDEPRDIVVDHNTVEFDGSAAVYAHGGTAAAPRRILGFQFTNNALRHNAYGINGAYFSWGSGILTSYFPDALVQGNWLQGGMASRYPTPNYFNGTFESAFLDAPAYDFRAAAGGPLIGRATDRTNIGADVPVVLAGVARGSEVVTAAPPARPANLRVVTK
jgi:hypothetical protein